MVRDLCLIAPHRAIHLKQPRRLVDLSQSYDFQPKRYVMNLALDSFSYGCTLCDALKRGIGGNGEVGDNPVEIIFALDFKLRWNLQRCSDSCNLTVASDALSREDQICSTDTPVSAVENKLATGTGVQRDV